MKEEYKDYYMFLEDLRESGVTNMFGAAPYLEARFPELKGKPAREVLANWMNNYDEIRNKYYN